MKTLKETQEEIAKLIKENIPNDVDLKLKKRLG